MEKLKRTLGFIYNHPLGKRHPFKSIIRFLLWQLQVSLSPSKFFIKEYIKPVKFYARKGLTGITGNIYTGLHEFNDMAFLLHFLRPDDVFFDIGANAGSYTLLASGISKAKSTAMEPVRSTFDILAKNMELNELGNKVSLINSAAGATTGTITFTASQDTTNHVIPEDEKDTSDAISVAVAPVDSLITGNQPNMIKIDVEGYETEVLKGMGHTLDLPSLKVIIIELNGSGLRYGYNEEEIHRLLLSKQFSACSYDPFKRSLTVMPGFSDHNTIYCRDMDFINARISTANGIKIMGEII